MNNISIEQKESPLIAIYGAQMVAVSIYHALKSISPECRVISFIVSEQNGNPTAIAGIPVVALAKFQRTDVKILIAVPENHHKTITEELKKKNLTDYVYIDSITEAALMEKYYSLTDDFLTLHSLKPGKTKADIAVYISKFHKDQPLKQHYEKADWIYPIQAGAALTDTRIADIGDHTGDHISEKNVNYSELSALYWIWKHASKDYLGLFHYRRMLDVKEEDLYRLAENQIDVVLPYPTIHYPNINEHYKRYLKEADWEAMLQALEECQPAYHAAFSEIFTQPYFYNYNMLIAGRDIFSNYCNWLFPILARTEELSIPPGNQRADRYIGYLGENLTTLYFMYHRKDFKIAHTGRRMLT